MARRISKPTYVGIDFSLTSPGVAIQEGHEGVTVEAIKTQKAIVPQKQTHRLNSISNAVIKPIVPFLQSHYIKDTYIFLEDYAYGGMGKTFAIAECVGMLKHKLLIGYGLPYKNLFLASIPHVKMFACGKGNAKKDTIIKEVYKRWKFDTNSNDKADAFVLMQMCYAYFNPHVDLTAFQIEALKRVKAYNEGHPNKKKKTKKV